MNDSELNAQIAERVMGWKITDKRPIDINNWRDYPDIWYSLPDGSLENILSSPYYANDIAAAWQVWEHLKGSDFWGEFLDAITPDGYYEGMYDLSPRVICLAALEAVGQVDQLNQIMLE